MTTFYKGDTVRAHWLEGRDHTVVLLNDIRLPASADLGSCAAVFCEQIRVWPWKDYCLLTLEHRPFRNKLRSIFMP